MYVTEGLNQLERRSNSWPVSRGFSSIFPKTTMMEQRNTFSEMGAGASRRSKSS